ncbi:MAG: YkgJ family cysteine cluster protein [Pseudomonadota bacterium]
MECRRGCGACCIAPSISSPIPGMPAGKPAGVRCVNLLDDQRCGVWNLPERPRVCAEFKPESWLCGTNKSQALDTITWLESA